MKRYTKEEINEVRDALLRGEIIAFGTDTVFGLACIYDDEEAIKKVYEAKNRDTSKALPMMCSGFDMIEKVAYVGVKAFKLMEAFMPGAITIIYEKKDVISDLVTCGMNTIGIRMPDDKWILRLIKLCGKPLLVTSANISNEPALFRWEDVEMKLEGRIDGIVTEDARGESASTIVDCSEEDIRILRTGPISEEDIMNALKE
ncbi:MAG: threonylcarbamoyl-AMP synthase [Erysipelotrichaceae bacterium]|nr:threonylcarbamoyl-AMP synthase [Erysipelotrichaceae bacterium]